MRVEFLRHGLPDGDKSLRGVTDFALTEQGFGQMKRSFGVESNVLDDEKRPDVIISSPLARCAKFALWLAEKEDIQLVLDPNWQEMDFGIWDGMSMSDIFKKYPQESDLFWRDPFAYYIPQSEAYLDFMLRIKRSWNLLLEEYYAKDKKILIVTHSGVMRQIIHQILQLPERSLTHFYQLNLPYAAKMQINISQDNSGNFWPQIQWPLAE